jgi:hypothetical protein
VIYNGPAGLLISYAFNEDAEMEFEIEPQDLIKKLKNKKT